jgi:hypothetical protein
MPLQIRRGTEAERQILAVAPAQGELIWITDDRKLYIGDGSALAKDLVPVTGFNDQDAVSAVADALQAGTHQNVIFTESAGAINAEVTLSDYTGTLTADAFKGTLVADDSTTLVNAVDGSINLDGTVKGHIIPDVNEQYDLGDSLHRFKDLWLSGSSIKLGNATITASGTAIDIPAGSTIGGSSISSPVGDFTGSVYADDSTQLIDGTGGLVVGNVSNTSVTTQNIAAAVIELSGTDAFGTKAGIRINTDGDASDAYDLITVAGASNNVDGQLIAFSRSRGTLAAPTALQDGDIITTLAWSGADADDTVQASAAMYVTVDGAPSSGRTPGKINFATFDALGAPVVGLAIDSNQIITFADTNEIEAGSGSGQVDLSTSTTAASFLRVKVGNQEYALPLYLINP